MEIYEKMVDGETLCDFLEKSHAVYMAIPDDFFTFRTGGGITFDIEDLPMALPIYKKYGMDGYNAILSFTEGYLPVEKYQTENFNKAMREINDKLPIRF